MNYLIIGPGGEILSEHASLENVRLSASLAPGRIGVASERNLYDRRIPANEIMPAMLAFAAICRANDILKNLQSAT